MVKSEDPIKCSGKKLFDKQKIKFINTQGQSPVHKSDVVWAHTLTQPTNVFYPPVRLRAACSVRGQCGPSLSASPWSQRSVRCPTRSRCSLSLRLCRPARSPIHLWQLETIVNEVFHSSLSHIYWHVISKSEGGVRNKYRIINKHCDWGLQGSLSQNCWQTRGATQPEILIVNQFKTQLKFLESLIKIDNSSYFDVAEFWCSGWLVCSSLCFQYWPAPVLWIGRSVGPRTMSVISQY